MGEGARHRGPGGAARRAERRGAPIYAEVVGYGMSADAYHISAPIRRARARRACMRAALARRRPRRRADRLHQRPRHLDAARRPLRGEAIKTVFGEHAYQLAVSSTKSDDRPPAGRGGRPRDGHPGARRPRPDPAADDQPRRPGRGLRPRLRPQHGARQGGPRYARQQLLRLRRHQRLGAHEAVRGRVRASPHPAGPGRGGSCLRDTARPSRVSSSWLKTARPFRRPGGCCSAVSRSGPDLRPRRSPVP